MISEIKDINEIGTIGDVGSDKGADLNKVKEAARIELIRSYEKISPLIDALSSSNLKRIIKFTTGYSEVKHLLTGEQPNLSDKEKELVDRILEFRSTLYGFYALLNESNGETETTTENIKENENE